ncbi:sigma-70 family RNA polymerase sigma factor [Chitinophaga horti]|uniref:Sigma-70 family RNA polymerase sigma factor n=1 Tax=Chitinophaga horti TaxID=2920382 RepID=A0ABY6J1T8_9BACT|nr:sigma-70 family RNA polymerase sigma factor [Chitinophaga horti]UYQ92117.1 sigma-70 family RNA polymerase sigma factor [Chitinophaga horti]
MYGNLNDKALWTKVIEGDKEALAFIYNRYFHSLFNYGARFNPDESLVKDCIHDLFVSIWLGRERLSVTDNIKYYLMASLKRRISAHSQKGTLQRLFDNDTAPGQHTGSHEEEMIGRQADLERRQKLAKVMEKLPKRQQEILYLRYYEGFDTKQTAELMSLSVNSTYVLLSKALNYLKKNSDQLLLLAGILLYLALSR